ncbi:phage tail tape measure protein [Laribacter hongkongensis]|uniref:phage tail tape measure protein n=1 Tax=Laribacter hongkongensis TaxID=168471 RepID=UPI001EFE2BD5|nr:phage tail tape measure protein [Laribacter hongkongensis]MCG9005136.1 phage tail tape measure protein [Laribacter hongkongensis]
MALSKNLRLEVILAATDKLTGPLKKAMAGSKGLAAAVRASQTGLKDLQSQQQRLTAFRDLSRETKDTAIKLKAARQNLAGLQQQMASAGTVTSSMTRKLATAQVAVDKLSSARSKQLATLRHNRRELEAQGLTVSKLASHEQRLGRQIDTASQALARQSEQLKRVSDRQKALQAAKGRYDRTLAVRDKVAGAGVATGAAGAAVSLPIVMAVKDYATSENAMLGIAKQVEGARDESGKLTAVYYQMDEALARLSETIPMTKVELAALTEGGARMGVQGQDNLMTFTRTAALASNAMELPADQLGEDLGKISNLYKLPIKNMEALGDAINYLDDNAQSKGGDIINVMQRTAGIVSSVAMKWQDGAALGSTFLSLGSGPEVAATATNAMIRELAIAEMQPKRFMEGLDMLGLKAEALQKGMAIDATGTILKVLDAIKKLPQEKQLVAATQLFGKEYGDDAAKLANNVEEYRRQLKLANSEEARGSMARESDARNQTLTAQWQMMQNRLFNVNAGMGQMLREPLLEVMNGLSGVLGSVRDWMKANPELTATIVKLIAVMAVLMTAVGGLFMVLAAVVGPMALFKLSMSTIGIKLASGIGIIGKLGAAVMWLGRIFLTTPIGLAVAAVAAAAYLVWSSWGVIAPKMQALWASVTGGANAAWQWVKSAILSVAGSIGDFLMNWTIVGFVSDHWQDIRAITLAVWSIIKTGVAAIGQALVGFFMNWTIVGAVISNWDAIKAATAAAWDWVRKLAVGAGSGILAFFMNWTLVGVVVRHWDSIISFMRGLVSTFTTIGSQIMQGMIAGLVSGLTSLKNTINGIGEGVISWLKDKLDIHSPSRVFAALGGFTMAGFQQGLEQGQAGPLGAVQNLAGKLTAIGAGVLVGGGLAQADAIRIDNRPPVAMSSPAASGSGTVVQQVFNIYAAPGMDERALAAMVRREVEAAARAQAVRGRSSLKDRE